MALSDLGSVIKLDKYRFDIVMKKGFNVIKDIKVYAYFSDSYNIIKSGNTFSII